MIDESMIKNDFDYFHKQKEIETAIISAKAKCEQISNLIVFLSEKDDYAFKKIISKYRADQKKLNANLISLNQDMEDLGKLYDKVCHRSDGKPLPQKILKRANEVSGTIDENRKLEETFLSTEVKNKFVCAEVKRLEKQQDNSEQIVFYIDFLKKLSVELEKRSKEEKEAFYDSEKIVFGGIDELFNLLDRHQKGFDETLEKE